MRTHSRAYRAARAAAELSLLGACQLGCGPRAERPGAAPIAAAAPKPERRLASVGTNLDGIADYAQSWVTVDAFKQSRPWISGSQASFDDGRPLALDAHGWVRELAPGQWARTLMFWDGVRYPSGDYVILYAGTGELGFWPQDQVIEARPGRSVLRVDSRRGGIGLVLRATDPRDPIRDIRVLMPGGACERSARRYCDASLPCGPSERCVPFEESYARQVFHPRFLERGAQYGALRFMDWMKTNGAELARWEDRPQPDDARWTRGVPLEAMVELANRQRQDPWFTLPHTADDDFVTHFAEYVRDHLDPARRVYVEHSNEVWNSAFPQARYALERGQAQGLGPSPFEAQLKFHARRTLRIAELFEQVFGAAAGKRLVRVLGAQAANPWTAEVMLADPAVRAHVDAVAIAPYFGGYLGAPEERERVERLSLDGLFDELKLRAIPEALGWVAGHARIARALGLSLLAYEGGQHLVGVGPAADSQPLNALFDRANRDPRMGALYTRYLAGWRQRGGTLFMHFTDCSGQSKYGRWGALEWLEQSRAGAPKYDALARFIAANPRWW
jgi:hypothetical protein